MKGHRARSGSFLLEILTEEIPARMMEDAIEDLKSVVDEALGSSRLKGVPGFSPHVEPLRLGTPRRLAVLASGLPPRQPDDHRTVIGPPVKAAYDSSGSPTRAAAGFARAQGVRVSDLERVATPRGECLQAIRLDRGLPAADALARTIPALVESMTFPKMMRWGTGEHRFVRPIHAVLALLDDRVLRMTITGIRSGRTTSGHRSASTRKLTIKTPWEYVPTLRRHGVIVDVEERRTTILDQLRRSAARAGGRIAPPPSSEGSSGEQGDPELLDEVVQLVEFPTIISGEFDAAFLDLPAEILVTAMRHHQKYFSLVGPSGKLLNRFLAVANATSDRSGAIRRGNQWVLRARLADARFFWDEDRRTRIADRGPDLKRVTFHEKLGSYSGKARRMEGLAGELLEPFRQAELEPDRESVLEAIRLCKNDLTTQVVKEFPELQGIVGGLYARADGHPARVAEAMATHYQPQGAVDPLPASAEGRLVSLADRLDTQAGLFLIGIQPTGSRDPYALRRSVQGSCRIVIESSIHVSLTDLIDRALAGYAGRDMPESIDPDRARAALLDFYGARLQYLGEEAGLRQDSVRAALAIGADDPYESRLRMNALDAIRRESGFDSLALAHKRIKNILKAQPAFSVAASRFQVEAERALHTGVEAARPAILNGVQRRDYLTTLRGIASLRPALDQFFDEVMVMADDPIMRENRLALLQSIASLFTKVGDFSEITVDSEPVPLATPRSRG
jgi:glycyl-tRNA synthetase beta chain